MYIYINRWKINIRNINSVYKYVLQIYKKYCSKENRKIHRKLRKSYENDRNIQNKVTESFVYLPDIS